MQNNKDNFTGKMFRRLWIPAMVSSFGCALSDMADAVVVGQKLGGVGLAAISLILPVYMINCVFAHGLGLGGSVKFSQLMGEGKEDEAKKCFGGIFWLAVILSLATALLGNVFMEGLLRILGTKAADGELYTATKGYLRILVSATPLFYMSNIFNYFLNNNESQKLGGLGSVTGNVIDITMNVVFVIFLNLGAPGAALATVVGQVAAISIYLPGFFKKTGSLKFSLPNLTDIKNAFAPLKAGLATSVQYLYQMIFFLISNNLLIRLGGETAVAIFDVLQNTSYLILYLFEGTSRAMQPILSTYQGEHNLEGRKRVMSLGLKSGLVVGGVLIVLVELFPGLMCSLFGIAGSSYEATAYIALRLYCAGAVFAGLNILICGYYQACGNEKPSFILETLRGAVLLIPMTLICRSFGLKYFWLLFILTEAGSLLIFWLTALGGRYRRAELPEERIFQRTVLSTADNVMDVSHELEAFCEKWGCGSKQSMLATMTVEEISMAILKMGFGGRTDGYIQITSIVTEDGTLELHMRDDATSFNPFDLSTNRASVGGDFDMDSMGVLVIKKRAREFFYRRYQGFNTLIIKI